MPRRLAPIFVYLLTASVLTTPSFAAEIYSEFQVPRILELEDQWRKRIWISKTARTLWKGYEIRDSRLFDRWMEMDEESVVLEMLADKRFVRTAIDFGYYYLGRKMSDAHFVWGDDLSVQQLEQYPQVINLARQLSLNKGDFFSFYDSNPEVYLLRLREPYWYEPEDGPKFFENEAEPTTPREIRERLNQYMLLGLQSFKNYIRNKGDEFNRAEFCADIFTTQPIDVFATNYGYNIISFFSHPDIVHNYLALSSYCIGTRDLDPEQILEKTEIIKDRLNALHIETMDNYNPDVYSPKKFEDLKPAPENLYPDRRSPAFQMSYNDYVNNNSTNFNRKRAAYMLDRYFCDDLTPVAIEDNGDHTEDRHGTQAACMACHYRLDPMAGFFRYNGFFFVNFKDQPNVVFDDQAFVPVEDYIGEWRNPAGSSREWNIGYVRSQNKEELNQYGESLDNLSEILKTAPEVRSCLVKRVFQYMTSSDQTFDGDYIDYITENFNTSAEENSLQAFKDLFGTAALSSTYSAEHRSPDECYDYRPGVDPENRPPCAVASILNSACVECHKSPGGKGNLNLDAWVEISPGVFSFEHYGEDFFTQLPKEETMARIAERISSPNPKLRMPKGGGYMTAVDRKDLYLWALEHSESEGGGE